MKLFGGTIHESIAKPRPKGYFLPGDTVIDRWHYYYDLVCGTIVEVFDEPDENGDDIVIDVYAIGNHWFDDFEEDHPIQRFHSGEFIHDFRCDIRRTTAMIENRGFELHSGEPI